MPCYFYGSQSVLLMSIDEQNSSTVFVVRVGIYLHGLSPHIEMLYPL